MPRDSEELGKERIKSQFVGNSQLIRRGKQDDLSMYNDRFEHQGDVVLRIWKTFHCEVILQIQDQPRKQLMKAPKHEVVWGFVSRSVHFYSF